MPKQRDSRIYTRNQGGKARYYGDVRDYSDVGGGREALIPRGQKKTATTDPDVAQELVAARVKELEQKRRNKQMRSRLTALLRSCRRARSGPARLFAFVG